MIDRGSDPLRPLLAAALLTGALAAAAFAQAVAGGDPAAALPQTPSVAPAVEPASGQAISTRSLLEIMRDGGPIMIPIAMCSFLLFSFVFERAISLRSGRVIPRPFVRRFMHQLHEGHLQPGQAVQLCEENRSPIAEVFAAAAKKWGRPAVEVEQAALDAGERVASKLRRYLRLFHSISTLSPLMGLLGTVVGMINSFNAIATADAMGRQEMLASGIGEALLTTAAGLSVAIPALIANFYFISRVDRLVTEIDRLSQELVNAIASDGWKRSAEKKPSKKELNKAA